VNFFLFDETVPSLDITGPARVNASYRNLHFGFNATSPVVLKNTDKLREIL